MKEVMIDFETLAKGENAVIIQIGAVYFDRNTGPSKDKRFLVNVDPRSYKQQGIKGDIDPDTVMWWLSQPKEAQSKIDNTNHSFTVYDAFKRLAVFLKDADKIWCHATFDFPKLDATLEQLELEKPYKYSAGRDLRTLVDISNYDYKNHKFTGTRHSALDDCLHQIDYALECFKRIRGM